MLDGVASRTRSQIPQVTVGLEGLGATTFVGQSSSTAVRRRTWMQAIVAFFAGTRMLGRAYRRRAASPPRQQNHWSATAAGAAIIAVVLLGQAPTSVGGEPSGRWQQLEPGLDLGEFLAPHASSVGDSKITAVRIDPA